MRTPMALLALTALAIPATYARDEADKDGLNPARPEYRTQDALYRIVAVPNGFAAKNHAQQIGLRFDNGHAGFTYGQYRFTMTLEGEGPVVRTTANGNRIEFEHGDLTEWFVNDGTGIEQGFTVAKRRSAGRLTIALKTDGDLTPALEGGDVALRSGRETVLRYAGLKSWDADGKTLPSHTVVAGSLIRLEVDDSNARYPVTVDPVLLQAILESPSALAGDRLGSSVALDGDTAVMGAPGHDLPGAADAGAVFVFTRAGSLWSQSAIFTAGVAGEGFGFSVAVSGDVAVAGVPNRSQTLNSVAYPNSGVVYVWVRTGGSWGVPQVLSASDVTNGAEFGYSVAVSGNTILVGARSWNNTGAAYVFTRSGLNPWTQQVKLTANDPASGDRFGVSGALDGDLCVIGASGKNSNSGAAYVFARAGTVWSQEARLTAPTTVANDFFGQRVALSGDTAIFGAPIRNNFQGTAEVHTRSGGAWNHQTTLAPADGDLALSGDTAVIGQGNTIARSYVYSRLGTSWSRQAVLSGAFDDHLAISGTTVLGGSVLESAGAGYVFLLQRVNLNSSPSSQSFSISGAPQSICPTGTYTTPYSGFWTTCTVTWDSPQGSSSTRFLFQNWSDGSTQNPRDILLTGDQPGTDFPYSANFQTQYLLTTNSVPISGGSVTGAGWYPAGTGAQVAATPGSGFWFTNFSDALSGSTSPQSLTMDGPKTVTGSFSALLPASLGGIISAKAGTAANRQWSIKLTNGGPGAAYEAQVFGLMFTQTFGTPCTALPVRLSPVSFPISIGGMATGSNITTNVALDFSGCPATARFTVSLGYMSNGGSSLGVIQLVNQLQ